MTTSAPAPIATDPPPNHHATFPAFAGAGGVLAALTFMVGRDADAALAIRLTGAGPGDDVLDVGCGPGIAVRRAAAAGAASVVGVDPAPVMLRVGRAIGRVHPGAAAVRYVEGAAEQLPLPDASVSVLWSLATVHHWRDLTIGLEEARRVLRPAGRLLAIERRATPGASGPASHGWTEGQAQRFAEQCAAAGFTGVDISQHRAGRKPVVAVLAEKPD
jgi:ubiquinone/menaquinone biosynthesis C-methylase UbiE